MKKQAVLARLQEIGLVPVLRAESVEQAMRLADAIADGGVTVLEVTMTVPGAIEVMRRLKRERPEILIGAGTVLDPETARMCILEGAKFVVSPALNVRTIQICQRYSVAVLPGALTPTEIVTAWQAGADVIKVFPASALGGAKYLKTLKAPLPQIEMIPTGGVSLGTALDFLQAGAFGLGVGGRLGSGQQWMSPIHVEDVVGIIVHLLEADDHNGPRAARGPFNAVCPEPVRNVDFTRAVGQAVGRPTVLPAPAFVLRGVMGEASHLLLDSIRVVPVRTRQAGYEFRFPTLGSILADLCRPKDANKD